MFSLKINTASLTKMMLAKSEYPFSTLLLLCAVIESWKVLFGGKQEEIGSIFSANKI